MNGHDWERFGDEIRRTIQDAVEYGNYDRLNQNITNTVNRVTEQINKSFGNTKHYTSQYKYRQSTYQQGNYQQENKIKRAEKYKGNISTKLLAILLAIIGYPTSAILLLIILVGFIGAVVTGEAVSELIAAVVVLLVITIGFAFLAYKGTSLLLRCTRFEKYVKEIGTAEFCNISDLAEPVGKSENFVVKDITKMIHKGWFKQGHLDRKKTCLIVTDQMYEQYKELEKQRDLQQKEEQNMAQKQAESRKGLTPEVQKVIDQGDVYVRKIRECNDAIPGEEISEKIYRIEIVVDKIFDRVEQNPNSVSDIRKLMDYYLPTTVKLLEAYAQMDAQPVGGENIQTAKREIEATLDTLNIAFEKLLDSLFQDAAWDVSSDISVLNTMLAQEGLKEDGLNK